MTNAPIPQRSAGCGAVRLCDLEPGISLTVVCYT